MTIGSGQDLLAKELRDIHSAEQMLSRALPRFSREVSSDTLREKLDERLEEGRDIMQAVEEQLRELELPLGRRKNVAMEGLLQDANELVREIEEDVVFDAGLISEVQKIQHYCIAAWGTTAAYAREMEEDALVDVMERALDEGKRYDEELNELAEEEINPLVFQAEDGEEMGEEAEQEQDGGGRTQRGRSSRSSAQASGGRSRQQASGRSSQQSRGRESGRSSQARSGGDGGRRSQARGSNGGRSSSRGEDWDLKEREYRDRQGNIHHHTRSYMARHRGR